MSRDVGPPGKAPRAVGRQEEFGESMDQSLDGDFSRKGVRQYKQLKVWVG